jgi:hypothetical protein
VSDDAVPSVSRLPAAPRRIAVPAASVAATVPNSTTSILPVPVVARSSPKAVPVTLAPALTVTFRGPLIVRATTPDAAPVMVPPRSSVTAPPAFVERASMPVPAVIAIRLDAAVLTETAPVPASAALMPNWVAKMLPPSVSATEVEPPVVRTTLASTPMFTGAPAAPICASVDRDRLPVPACTKNALNGPPAGAITD